MPGGFDTSGYTQELAGMYGTSSDFWNEYFGGLEDTTGLNIGLDPTTAIDDYFSDQWNQETGEGSQVGWIYNQVQESLVNDPESLVGGVDGLNACLAGCSENISTSSVTYDDMVNELESYAESDAWSDEAYSAMLSNLSSSYSEGITGVNMEQLGGATSCMESCYTNALLGTDDAGDF